MGRKTSLVWNHFKIPEMFPKKAMCNYCNAMFGRGQKNMGTTSLLNHLKRCREFKMAILASQGINFNDSTDDSFNFFGEEPFALKNPTETCSDDESNPPSTSDVEINPLSPSDNESSLPSLVMPRRTHREPGQAPVQEYRNNGRPSLLLYGDINSTPDPVEEPTSSTVLDQHAHTGAKPHPHELMAYMCSGKDVNFVYGGFMLHMLYEQYKAGSYCDLQLVTQSQVSNEGMISETGKITHKNVTLGKEKHEIKVHTCLLAAVSKKISLLVEMGCTTIQLKKGSYDAVRGLMEIVYTGKLGKIRDYSRAQLREILEVAKFLEVDFATSYLANEIDEMTAKVGRAPHKSVQHEVGRLLEAIEYDNSKRLSSSPLASTPPSNTQKVNADKRKRADEAQTTTTPEQQFMFQRPQSTEHCETSGQNVEIPRMTSATPVMQPKAARRESDTKRQKLDVPDLWKVKAEPSRDVGYIGTQSQVGYDGTHSESGHIRSPEIRRKETPRQKGHGATSIKEELDGARQQTPLDLAHDRVGSGTANVRVSPGVEHNPTRPDT